MTPSSPIGVIYGRNDGEQAGKDIMTEMSRNFQGFLVSGVILIIAAAWITWKIKK